MQPLPIGPSAGMCSKPQPILTGFVNVYNEGNTFRFGGVFTERARADKIASYDPHQRVHVIEISYDPNQPEAKP